MYIMDCYCHVCRDLSQDEAFIDEIRTSLRFIVSVLLRRAQKVSKLLCQF